MTPQGLLGRSAPGAARTLARQRPAPARAAARRAAAAPLRPGARPRGPAAAPRAEAPGGGGGGGNDERPQPAAPLAAAGAGGDGASAAPSPLSAPNGDIEGPSTDPAVIYDRLIKLALPYWVETPSARWRLAGVVALTLGTTGVSVLFNFLGRDFFNALSARDVDAFQTQLMRYLGGFAVGVPVFVVKRYFQSRLALQWREWMTARLLSQYFRDRSFYQLQAGGMVDNPDQRIAADVRTFTDTALSLSLTLLNALVDLVSFSGILYSIYPPLFAALLLYSLGGTAASVALGRNLVALNFNQEAREADLRYGLVRVRENAESIAFYGGESSEMRALTQRLGRVVSNYSSLITSSARLDLFTSFYRFVIQLLPAAVVAPLYFQGKIDFGVINQSQSAFNHILSDVSLVVYQFEALAGFSAVIDRLGEFSEVSDIKLRHVFTIEGAEDGAPAAAPAAGAAGAAATAAAGATSAAAAKNGAAAANDGAALRRAPRPTAASAAAAAAAGPGGITIVHLGPAPAPPSSAAANGSSSRAASGQLLLELRGLCISTPDGSAKLAQQLDLEVRSGESLLIAGSGTVLSHGLPGLGDPGCQPGSVLFLPQKPYMVLGSLRDQMLYPTWSERPASETATAGDEAGGAGARTEAVPRPDDAALEAALQKVQLSSLLERCRVAARAGRGSGGGGGGAAGSGGGGSGISGGGAGASPLDCVAEWSQLLSLGEQQRLAFARLLLTAPRLALIDEATSALDTTNEALLYRAVLDAGVTLISVGHRPSLVRYHQRVLQLGPSRGPELGAEWSLSSADEYAAAGALAAP
ncbi:hypothetical protein Rsub_01190 [Raphidocelis subcapitata]|uniref:ABC transporter D family member chloroplastic n=1 Tax=Raphidocelis subcapitata TaxID=307507 RepID=A0A2V0NU74_9CHLO|nr:hypothetical protein Rsub_01190 [Raphidocelis subcapitata]|eukprot:GBF88477.1 hypothetical protein Rsub_01190 [Raphidocelis subcapitata]